MRTTLTHQTLSSQAADLLRDLICHGLWEPGARVVVDRLAVELGISRTPLREALFQLEREALVVLTPARGFRVAPLSSREVTDLYPILGVLEALALRSITEFEEERIEHLRAIDHQMQEPGRSGPELMRLDTEWHETLLGMATNEEARRMVASLRRRVQRYEVAFMSDQAAARRSPIEHEELLDALVSGDIDWAAQIISAQWINAVSVVLMQIARRGMGKKTK